MNDAAPPRRIVSFGSFQCDVCAGELRKNGIKVKLADQPFRLLTILLEHPSEVVARQELREKLWATDTYVDFDDGLNTAVNKLRAALGDDPENPRFVETLPRRGYRFLAPVEIAEQSNGRPQSAAHGNGAAVSHPSATIDDAPAIAGRRISWKGWALFAGTVVLLVAAAGWLLRAHSVLALRSDDSVLVADFENDTGDARFDQALDTAFTVSLEQARNFNVFSRFRLPEVLQRMGQPATERITAGVGREICQRESIRGMIACAITRTGQEYVLTAELVDPQTGATERSYTEQAHGEENILNALDSLSQKIRRSLGESLYQIHLSDRPLPQVTTTSLTALKDYADGVSLWHEGKYKEALPLYHAAVAADSNFAMAYAALAEADCSYINNAQALCRQEYERALALSDHVTNRERMIIQADYADDMDYADQAVTLYKSYLGEYPDDWKMLRNYASLLRMHGRATEAIPEYRQVLRVAPDDAGTYVEMATAYSELHDFSSALRAYSQAFQIDPSRLTAGNTNREYGIALVDAGQSEKAEQLYSALLAKPETRENGLRSLAFLNLYYGRYAKAEDLFNEALALDEDGHQAFSSARVQYMLGEIAEGEGNSRRQIEELDAAMTSFKDIGPKVVYGALIGQAYARAGSVAKAEKILAAITPLVDPRNAQETKHLRLLQAEIALAGGNPEKALKIILPPTPTDDSSTRAVLTEFMGYANQRAGHTASAIPWYEKLLADQPGIVAWEPQQRYLQARYFLAEDYLNAGNRQKAGAEIAELLKLWANADATLPLRKEALMLKARIGASVRSAG
jgi:eukaryotic-like serine/threonine-protein kinase